MEMLCETSEIPDANNPEVDIQKIREFMQNLVAFIKNLASNNITIAKPDTTTAMEDLTWHLQNLDLTEANVYMLLSRHGLQQDILNQVQTIFEYVIIEIKEKSESFICIMELRLVIIAIFEMQNSHLFETHFFHPLFNKIFGKLFNLMEEAESMALNRVCSVLNDLLKNDQTDFVALLVCRAIKKYVTVMGMKPTLTDWETERLLQYLRMFRLIVHRNRIPHMEIEKVRKALLKLKKKNDHLPTVVETAISVPIGWVALHYPN